MKPEFEHLRESPRFEMQEEPRRYSWKVVADDGTTIEARNGANSGEVVVRSIQTGTGHV